LLWSWLNWWRSYGRLLLSELLWLWLLWLLTGKAVILKLLCLCLCSEFILFNFLQ
jgi:hypothetical protein